MILMDGSQRFQLRLKTFVVVGSSVSMREYLIFLIVIPGNRSQCLRQISESDPFFFMDFAMQSM